MSSKSNLKLHSKSASKQHGITIVSLIIILGMLGFIGLIALKVVPTVTEFMSIKKALFKAKDSGLTVAEVKSSFDKQTDTSYIESVSSKDLEVTKDGDRIDLSVAYAKKIPLFGPASLVIDYAASTAPAGTESRVSAAQKKSAN